MAKTTHSVALALLLAGSGAASAESISCPADPAAAPEFSSRYDGLILKHAEKRRLNPRLVKAIIMTESQFSPRAVSRRGARGLMQLMPNTSSEMGVPPGELFEPEDNIRAGTAYLALLFAAQRRRGVPRGPASAGMVRRAVAAYHSGPSALGSAGEWAPATRDYVSAVMACYRSEGSVLRRPRIAGDLLARTEAPGLH